jgi:antitoxin YefM
MTETTYTSLRQSLASVLDRVANDREVVIVRRKGEQRVALVPADELAGLMETAHLLRSPRNAQRLLSALRRATGGRGKQQAADKALEKLRREMGVAGGR